MRLRWWPKRSNATADQGTSRKALCARLYREAPLNGIWEGSGNIMALDVLRTLINEPEAKTALFAELKQARGSDDNLDCGVDGLRLALADRDGIEGRMRIITEQVALVWQGALLTRHGDAAVAQAFCASRLANGYRGTFGTLPGRCRIGNIVTRALGAKA